MHVSIPADTRKQLEQLVQRVQALPLGFVSEVKWKEFATRCRDCKDAKDLKNLKISLTKWEKNVKALEKNWEDSRIDVERRNTTFQQLCEHSERLRQPPLGAAKNVFEAHRRVQACQQEVTKALKNASFLPEHVSKFDRWRARIEEYERLYLDATGNTATLERV